MSIIGTRLVVQFVEADEGRLRASERVGGRTAFPKLEDGKTPALYEWWEAEVMSVGRSVCLLRCLRRIDPSSMYYVSDEHYSRLAGYVLRADGSEAVEGRHYYTWTDASPKNGKWTHTPAGIVSNGAKVCFVVERRSKNSGSSYWIVCLNEEGQIVEARWCGPLGEEPQLPPCPASVPEMVYRTIVDTFLPEQTRARWAALEGYTLCPINDASGSALLKWAPPSDEASADSPLDLVLRSDGSPAVRGDDYQIWTGTRHRDHDRPAWSEGGIAVLPNTGTLAHCI